MPKALVEHEKLLDALQASHDTECHWFSTQDMRDRLTSVAARHGLAAGFLSGLSFADR